MSRPLITVGLTTYNAATTLESALSAIFSQTWQPIEVVAVDDCSTDGTFEILQQHAKCHPELRLFRNPTNSGVAVTRNRILEEARGEFVAFFDDDDQSKPERLSMQYERIVRYERRFAEGCPVICHTARRVSYPDGTLRVESTMGTRLNHRAPAGPAVAQRILFGKPLKDANGACPTCSQMARLSTYHALKGFDPSLRRGEDTDLNIRLAYLGGHFAGIAEPLVNQQMTRSSDKSLEDEYHNMRRLLEKHRHFIESQSGHFPFCLAWLDAKHAWLKGHRAAFLRKMVRIGLTHPLLTLTRVVYALPNVALNRAFSRFHLVSKDVSE